MSADGKSKLIRLMSVLGDFLTVFICVVRIFERTGAGGSGMTAFYYGFAFSAAVIFNYIMLDLYSLKAENIYNALVSVGIAVIVAYVCIYVFSKALWCAQQPIAFWGSLFFILLLTELIWRMMVAYAKKKLGKKRSFLIVENMKNTSRLARKLKYASNEENSSWYHLLDENNPDEMQKLLDEMIPRFDAIFISPQISHKAAEKILYCGLSQGIQVNILADVDGITTLKGKIYQIDDTPVIVKKAIQLTRFEKIIKRTFDIIFALFAIVVTLPVMLICAAAIKLDSKGPVFYKQERYTLHKKVFRVYKLRTMVTDAEKNGAQLAAENDPRITRAGKVLRALRLDELPQIYNILGGSMSVVGPRPERPVFADEYSKAIASYDMRYCMKAGLTGYAQVYGRYNTRVSDKILMDIIYGTNYSLLLDVKLILLTIKIMFMKSAAEGVNEKRDEDLSSAEREEQRRNVSESVIGMQRENGEENEDISYHSGI